MLNSRLFTATLCAITLSLTVQAARAADSDNDGVPDGIDVCCNTPVGTPVNSVGRPIADLDNDCDVDMVDFGIFQISLTGPMTCSPEVCDGIDNDCNCIIDDLPPVTCGTGACQVTMSACVNGVPQTCTPGAPSPEICDGIDNDCDGSVDENLPAATWYQDQDGDGYGNPGNSITACTPPAGYTAIPGDCDDTNPTINPSAAELCNNIDDDCNGNVDDNAVGGTPWYADVDGDGYGNPNSQIFACTPPIGYVANANDCDDLNALTHPGGFEVCNGNDDDCDGFVDEGLGTITCGTGACQNTVPACVNGQANMCTPGNSSPEICDGVDNDCDGFTDEGLVNCNSNCPNNPQPEVCNGIDDDCNGNVDDLPPITCGTGACQNTVPACVNGQPNMCTPGNSSPEICDGIDNDCDGSVDENNPCTIVPNATGTCSGVSCLYACDAGYSDCNGTWLDGCEVSVNTDPNNCGGCGMVCPSRPNATTTCNNGNCGYFCNAGYADCNNSWADGCEVNLNADSVNCGACGAVCPTGYSCQSGQCQLAPINPN